MKWFTKKVTYSTGAGLDNRVTEQKQKDWRPEEAFASAPALIWKEKTIEEIEAELNAQVISQGGTSRCVSEYAGIALEVAEYLENGKRIAFSRRDVYARRFNRPDGGMAMFDLFKVMREGACYEEQLPSTATREAELNEPYDVTQEMTKARSTHASGASFTWTNWTIDDIAGTIEQQIPVCLFWYFDNAGYNEWWKPQPKVLRDVDLYAQDTARHQATGFSYFLKDGVKHIAVADSSGQGTGLGSKKHIRYISEDFFEERCYGAGFAIDKANLDYTAPKKFTYTFTKPLKYGDIGEDVKALQKVLVLEGCLVLKEPTGNFYGMTRSGVIKLQEKYASAILTPVGLKTGTGYVGTSTLKWLTANYGK